MRKGQPPRIQRRHRAVGSGTRAGGWRPASGVPRAARSRARNAHYKRPPIRQKQGADPTGIVDPARRRRRVPALAFAQMRAPNHRSGSRLLRTTSARARGMIAQAALPHPCKSSSARVTAPIHASRHSICGVAPRASRYRFRCSLSVLVLSVKPRVGRGVGLVGGAGRVRADAQPYLGPRSGVAPGRRHDG
jgi:hypothetical protein